MGALTSPATLQAYSSLPEAHIVQFYTQDRALITGLTAFTANALEEGESVVIIATRAHIRSLKASLRRRGLAVEDLVQDRRLGLYSAAETLSTFIDGNGWPNRALFFHNCGDILRRAARAATAIHKPVAAFGEMVALLWADGKHEAAIELERLWNELALIHHFSLYCAYPLTDDVKGEAYAEICAEHSVVVPA